MSYLTVRVGDVVRKVHQVIFEKFHGYIPDEVDHIDNDTMNNSIENLRDVTRSQNQCNRLLQANNTSTVKGVNWDKSSERWRARVAHKGISYFVGRFDNLEEADVAVRLKRIELHKEFTNHG